jgi:hypothetical protein
MTEASAEPASPVDLPLRTLGVAALLGIVGDLLLYPTPWGAGVPVFFALATAACAYLYRSGSQPIAPSVRWIAPAVLLFALGFAWRDAEALRGLNGLAIVLLVGLASLRRREGRFAVATVLDYPFRLLWTWFENIGDAYHLLNLEGQWPALRKRKGGQGVAATARGLLLAVPLLLIFGGLFASADASFERLLSQTFNFDLESGFYHALTTGTILLLAGGFLRRMFVAVAPPPVRPAGAPAPGSTLGITEVAIVLGSLNLLFAAFVATQFDRLFGGAEIVRTTAGLGVAEYARRGFFELATVAFLTLTLLLGTHAILRREGGAERIYRALAAGLVVLVFVVMQSAVMRMRLYVDAFGTTQLRIYVLAAIGGIAAVFVWFAMTSLRGRHDRFAFGALLIFLGGIVGLNVANPDAIVARINTARPETVDAAYLNTLSEDAVPELVKALPSLPLETRAVLEEGLRNHRASAATGDWRDWNLARREALAALRTTN